MTHQKNCLIYICTCDKLVPYEDVVELIESDPLVKAIFEDRLDILVKKQINEYLEANFILFEDKHIPLKDRAFLRSFQKKN